MAKKDKNVGMLANRSGLQSIIAGLSEFASERGEHRDKMDVAKTRGIAQEINAQNRYSRTLSRDELIRQNRLNDAAAKEREMDKNRQEEFEMKNFPNLYKPRDQMSDDELNQYSRDLEQEKKRRFEQKKKEDAKKLEGKSKGLDF